MPSKSGTGRDVGAENAGHVWYVSYGSNTHAARLNRYLAACRDTRPPLASAPVELSGVLYFATESLLWTGGRAFYDPGAPGQVRARAYLLSPQQFCDVAAQEMYRRPGPGTDLDLKRVVREERVELGPGRYETLVCAGMREGRPLLTFTAPWGVHDVPWNRPAAAYLAHLYAGLTETGAWPPADLAAYLAGAPGAAGHWSAREIAALPAAPPGPADPPRPADPPGPADPAGWTA
ncbi:histone deacetylase [Streptomyces sp. NPDC087440]|uniref:histone deacetylase n=1 Tax=Streptomyces sp. NPDC087440 TaxID=3365790 RepID=UPI0038028254